MEQLDWVGGIEKSVGFGVALAERHIADLVEGSFRGCRVVGGDFALDVLVVAQQFRYPKRPRCIAYRVFEVSVMIP